MKQQKKFATDVTTQASSTSGSEGSKPAQRLCKSRKPRNVVTCLEIRLSDVRGKFDANKAKQFGITGRNCGELVKGNSVVNKDGRTVRQRTLFFRKSHI